MKTLLALVLVSLLYSVTEAKDVQLFNPDCLGQPTSTAIKLLYDKNLNEIEPYMVTTDIDCGRYRAASVFYREKVTFADVRASLNRLYKNYENLSLLEESKQARWRVEDKQFLINLVQEQEGIIRVMYLQFRPMKGVYQRLQ